MANFTKFTKVTRKSDGKTFLNVVNDKGVGYPVSGDFKEITGIIKELTIPVALDKIMLREGDYGLYASISADYESEEFTV